MEKEILLGKTLDELKSIVRDLGMPTFTAKQIAQWLYEKRVHSLDDMTNISMKNRQLLSEKCELGVEKPVHSAKSIDGTIKYLFKVQGEQYIESVYIPDGDRATLCISSQVGCKMNCKFCMTGKQGFKGNLSASDILNQIVAIPETHKLSNIVYMGMGEPFDNIDTVLKTIDIITADYGMQWSPRRITVSSIGVVPALKRFLDECNAHLAISLHSPFDTERQELMPIQKVYPVSDVVETIRNHHFGRQRRISFEYIMFDGLNDSLRHAVGLRKLLVNVDARVNLIRFHAIPNVDLQTSNTEKMQHFADYLNDNGLRTTIRQSRGEDIEAACGMLSTKELEKNRE